MIEEEKKFQEYLINSGYKVSTPNGNKSTVYDYVKRVKNVCEIENISWKCLAENIDEIIRLYDTGGAKESIGNKSHRSVINALKAYKKFCLENQ